MDLTGHKYGRLTVIGPWEKRPHGTYWKCLCDCGSIKWMCVKDLRKGEKTPLNKQAKSCGCLHREWLRETKTKHGHAKAPKGEKRIPTMAYTTREYRIWIAMKQRCHCPTAGSYEYYGGRGITVCDRWRYSFQNFITDMGPAPTEKSLDRIDPWGPYAPNNCRWATMKEQNNNQRKHQNRIRDLHFYFLGRLIRVGESASFVISWVP